jgi:hypothetical protein
VLLQECFLSCLTTQLTEYPWILSSVNIMGSATGACPRSYGTNVARLAGLPEQVVMRAAHISHAKELEKESLEGSSEMLGKADERAGPLNSASVTNRAAHSCERSSLRLTDQAGGTSGSIRLVETMETVVGKLQAALGCHELEFEINLSKIKELCSTSFP